jgi:fructokinase
MTSTMTSQLSAPVTMDEPLIGAIEGGGTKFVCAVGYGSESTIAERRIETRAPQETIREIVAFFAAHPITALGIGMFGPLELRDCDNRGSILATTKPGWKGFPFRQRLSEHLSVPIAIDTDVNAAAIGEACWGAAQGCSVVLYVTVGTGVGGGVLVAGQPLHGLMHAEFGHIPMPVLSDANGCPDTFEGSCPYHGRCLEGLIAGPSLLQRTGKKGETLQPDDSAFDWAARYLGVGLASAVMMLSPERIIVGGGVMASPLMLPRAREELTRALGGYIVRPEVSPDNIDSYVVAPGLGTRSGVAGAFALAKSCLTR